MKLLRTPILNNTCLQLLLNWLYEVIVCNFVSGSLLKPSWVILQKYQLLSNKSFKENLAHMLPIYLTPTFSCGFRFPYTNGAVGRKIVLSFTECLVCVCVLFIYTISISIICASQEELSLIPPNQQIWLLQVNNFWKEKTLWEVNFWYQWMIYLII